MHSGRGVILKFHPSIKTLIATASIEQGGSATVKLTNLETGAELYSIPHSDLVFSIAFDHAGEQLSTMSRDGFVRSFELRSGQSISKGFSHVGTKGGRIVYLDDSSNLLVSVGFEKY